MDEASGPALQPGRHALPAVALGAALVVVAALFHGGGSTTDTLHVTGGIAVLVAALGLGAAALGRLPVPRLDRAGRVAVGAAVGLTVWAGASIAWSIAADLSWDWLNRGLVLLAFLALGLLLGALPRGREALAWILTGAIAAVVGWALLGACVPALAPDGDRVARLREPIGYWNALALVADVGLVLGVRAARSGGRGWRVAGSLLVFGSVVALLLTQSRAGLLAGLVVVVVAVLTAPGRLEAAVAAIVGALPGAAVAGWAFTRSALVDDGVGRAARESDGRLFAAALALGAVATVVAALAVPDGAATRHAAAARRVVIGAVVVLLLAGAVGLVAAVGNPARWAGDQLNGGECSNDPGRYAQLCDNNRLQWWGDALRVARDHPLAGTGAGTYAVARLRVRGDATPVVEPHSVPFQLLSDLGIVGLALGLAAAVAAAVGVVRGVRRVDADERWTAVAVATLPLAFVLHALVDYDLDFLAVSGPTALAVGALLVAGRPARRVRGGIPAVVALVAATAAVLASLWLPALARDVVDRSYAAASPVRAAQLARRAQALDPLSLDPVLAEATAAERGGDQARAQELLERATRMQPENPEPWLELARFHSTADPPRWCAAYKAYNQAYTLDPRSSRWVTGGPLDVARDAVNAGACETETAP